jgi:hypothetical protein
MELHQALIKNFNDYLAGREVEATIHLKDGETVIEGERVLAVKDSISATTDVPVPRSKQVLAIGIEGTVTEIGMRGPSASPRTQIVKVKKL